MVTASMINAAVELLLLQRSLHPCVGIVRLHQLMMDKIYSDCPFSDQGVSCYIESSSEGAELIIGGTEPFYSETGALPNTLPPNTYPGTSEGDNPQLISSPFNSNANIPVLEALNFVHNQNSPFDFYTSTSSVPDVLPDIPDDSALNAGPGTPFYTFPKS